jgi:PAS domain S-box-containing protein
MDMRTVPARGPIVDFNGRVALRALLVAGAYYCGARIGAALSFQDAPTAVVWPPSAILLAGLLMSPLGSWWAILLAVLPMQLAVGLQAGAIPAAPLALMLERYISNCGGAVLGAAAIGKLLRQPPRFDSLRHVAVFLLCGILLAPFTTSLLAAALGESHSVGLWSSHALANSLATLAIVPVLLAWHTGLRSSLIANASFLLLTSICVAGTLQGVAPFAFIAALPLQLALIACGATLLLLSAAIQERKAGEGSLQRQHETLSLALDVARLGTWELDLRSGTASCSLELKGLLGLTGDATTQLPIDTLLERLHPDGQAGARRLLDRAAALGSSIETECQIVLPDGEVRTLLNKAAIGRAGHIYGVTLDVTDRKRTEQQAGEQARLTQMTQSLEQRVAERTAELRRANDVLRSVVAGRKKAIKAERMSEARFSNVFRFSPDAMSISFGFGGPVVDVNDRWQQLFGYQRAEVIGKTAHQLKLYASEAVDGANQDEPDMIHELEVAMRNREGAILHTVVSGGRIDCGGASCFITIVRDVTAQRQRESEAQQQQEQLTYLTRVVVLGELSGALAHELNQPLAAILTNAQAARRFLRREPADLHEIGDILDDIVDEDKRAGEVIRRVRALFMKGDPVLQPLDINELVRDALALTNSTLIERKVPVILELGSGVGTVLGDRVQLQQVLLNLIVNACEAMSTTTARSRRLGLLTDAESGREVHIAVTDTGPGIAPEAIGKVFDSFFTTKAYGLGFGLSITRAIIEKHGGRIEASNRPEGGAVFRITLPLDGGGS